MLSREFIRENEINMLQPSETHLTVHVSEYEDFLIPLNPPLIPLDRLSTQGFERTSMRSIFRGYVMDCSYEWIPLKMNRGQEAILDYDWSKN